MVIICLDVNFILNHISPYTSSMATIVTVDLNTALIYGVFLGY